MTEEEWREYTKDYLDLTDAQYDEHQRLWNQKMTEWPADLWRFVYRVQRRFGLCGEVISTAIADWLRGDYRYAIERPEDV